MLVIVYILENINIVLLQDLWDNFAITRVYVSVVDSQKCIVALCDWSTRNIPAVIKTVINTVRSVHDTCVARKYKHHKLGN